MKNIAFFYSKDRYSEFYERFPLSDEDSAQNTQKFTPMD
jgi:hypothetical protein